MIPSHTLGLLQQHSERIVPRLGYYYSLIIEQRCRTTMFVNTE